MAEGIDNVNVYEVLFACMIVVTFINLWIFFYIYMLGGFNNE